MEEKRSLEVTVAGYKLAIKTSAPVQQVQAAAELVEAKLGEVSANKSLLSNQVLLLTALILADELIRTRTEKVSFQDLVKNRSESLLSELDKQFGLQS